MTNLIRIFAFPSHSPKEHISGVDYPRIIQPMKFLNNYKDKEVEIQVDLWDGKKIGVERWNEMIPNYDIVYFNYTVNDWSFAAMGSMARKHHKKLVMDIDDALWHMLPDNTVYKTYEKGSRGISIITAIINEVDYVTCTNSYLRNVIVNNTLKNHEHVVCFPNYIDLDLYKYQPPMRNSPFINIVHYGSSSHYADLKSTDFQQAMDKIMYEYPNVTFLTVGSFFPELKEKWGKRYEEQFGALNLMDWITKKFPEVMEKTDIFVAPLGDNVYNRSKSDIKRSEVGTAKRPFIGQDIRQYRECITDGVDGYLARTSDEWYGKIKTLCDDRDLRVKIGEEGFKRVKRDMQMKDHLEEYAQFFRKVVGI